MLIGINYRIENTNESKYIEKQYDFPIIAHIAP